MDDAPREAARRFMADGEAGLAVVLAQADAIHLAWALKAECYEAWNTAPPRARVAAARLEALAAARPGDHEVQALAAWAAGIGALTEGRMADALAALQRAQGGFVQQGRDDLAAQTQVPQLMALAILGRHDEALRCGEEALARFVATGDEHAAGKIELNLGNLLSRQDRHAESAAFYRRAILRFARARDLEHSIMGDIGLSNALAWQFDFDEALRIAERARMRADTHGYPVLRAQADSAIGRLELHRGRVDRALPALARACDALTASGVAPRRIAEAEAALADAYLSINLLPEGVALYSQAADRCRSTDAQVELARCTLRHAEAIARLGDATAAADGLQRARNLYRALDNPVSAAIAELGLASLHLATGPIDQALAEARDLASTFARHGLRGWQCEAQLLAARALCRRGERDAARELYRLTLDEASGLVHLELMCLTGLGLIERDAGRIAEAVTCLEAAVARVEMQRAALPGDEFRAAFAADKEAAFDGLVELALIDAGPGAAGLLWRRMEAGRSRALELGLGRAEAAVADDAASAARTRLHWLREEEQRALASGDGAGAVALADRAQTIERELLETDRRSQLTRGAPSPAAAAVGDAGMLCAELSEDQALVEFHLLGDRLLACVLDRDRVTHHQWAVPGLTERLAGLRFQIDALRGGASHLARHADQLLARARAHLLALYRLCWEPVAARVRGRRQLVVVPHRLLHYVPFGALHDGEAWLVARHELVQSPSAAIWRAGRDRARGRHDSVLAVGVGGPALPHVQREVDAVQAAFGPHAATLRGDQATTAALRGAVPGADVVHLACHGTFRADSPYFSSLSLADGPLTLRDAAALPLTASLVTLSACETALSRVAPGDELVGLVRGFLLAGVPSIVASLWTVDDASTASLMQDFYAGLRAGQGPAAALAGAQRTMAGQGAHPFHWAAFAVHGRG